MDLPVFGAGLSLMAFMRLFWAPEGAGPPPGVAARGAAEPGGKAGGRTCRSCSTGRIFRRFFGNFARA